MEQNHSLKLKTVSESICTVIISFSYFFEYINKIYNLIGDDIALYALFFISFLGLLISFLFSKDRIQIYVIGFIFMTYLSLVTSSLVNHNINMNTILLYSRYIFLFIILYNNKLNYKVVSIFVYTLLLLHIPIIISGINSSSLLGDISRNGISIYLLVNVCLYYISSYQNGKKIHLLPGMATVLISLWANGRSGAITSIILLLCLIFKSDYNRKKKYTIFFSFIVISLLFLFIFRNDTLKNLFYEGIIERFNVKYTGDRSRIDIMFDYIKYCSNNTISLIFGAHRMDVPLIDYLEGNPHNSFINLHALFGLPYFVYMIYSIFQTFIKLIKRNFLFFSLLLVLVLRASTDIPAFIGLYDPIIFYFIIKAKLERIKSGESIKV